MVPDVRFSHISVGYATWAIDQQLVHSFLVQDFVYWCPKVVTESQFILYEGNTAWAKIVKRPDVFIYVHLLIISLRFQ